MIAILKYNAGNTRSVENAMHRLGCEVIVTDDVSLLKRAERVIIPGVGEASSAMRYFKEKKLDVAIKSLTQPVLGICLGMQLLCEFSEEGNTLGLGIFKTRVQQFPSKALVPHMGWNTMIGTKSGLFQEVSKENDCYFVHSYYANLCSETIATTTYILPFSAALQKDNFYGTQFHPEKSAVQGEVILRNFLKL